MTIIVSDKKLVAIILYSAFVNHEFLTPVRDIWKDSWAIGIAGATVLGLVGWFIAPMILSAIIYALGFSTEGVAASSFGSWFMSLYRGMIERGSLISVLQSIGASGLGVLGTITSAFGAALGILIGGHKLAEYLIEMDLNEHEKQMLENFVQIEENTFKNNSMIVFTLMPALLYSDVMLKCFVETFITGSDFANSKLFRFNFKENDLSKLKSEEERVNHTVYNLLISNYKESRVKYIFRDDCLIGYNLDLSDHTPSDYKVKLLVEVWKYINGNIIIDIDILHQIGDFFHDQLKKAKDFFRNFHDL